MYTQTHPYLAIPFGHGQRSCIARRLAEQNMVVTTLKVNLTNLTRMLDDNKFLQLIRRYKLEWMGSDLDCTTLPVNKPDGPILLKLTQR